MILKRINGLILLLFCCCAMAAQSALTVMSYNVENLFDTEADSIAYDVEFLPEGIRGWNYGRYQKKLTQIAQVIAAANGWEPPGLIGLCEIENRHVLNDLTRWSPLRQLGYKFIHYESPDRRGIDVALLYRKELFDLLHAYPIRINFPQDSARTTRDLLYACGRLPSDDTLHIFVAHFPSRFGGEMESEPLRIQVAHLLRQAVDTLLDKNPETNILIMGDFNDYPTNQSVAQTLKAEALSKTTHIQPQALYNLCYELHTSNTIGSYKHDGQWGMLDQIIVSGNLLDTTKNTSAKASTARIFAPEWLLESDDLGVRPFRTYVGSRYHGGYSDHLPVLIDFLLK